MKTKELKVGNTRFWLPPRLSVKFTNDPPAYPHAKYAHKVHFQTYRSWPGKVLGGFRLRVLNLNMRLWVI